MESWRSPLASEYTAILGMDALAEHRPMPCGGEPFQDAHGRIIRIKSSTASVTMGSPQVFAQAVVDVDDSRSALACRFAAQGPQRPFSSLLENCSPFCPLENS